MKSVRRNTLAMQRDGSSNQFQETVDNSPSPTKLYHSKTFLTLRGLLTSLPFSLDFLPIRRSKTGSTGNLAQRHQRSKGFKWKRALFNLLLCFVFGAFVGFTPFFSINMPELNVFTPDRQKDTQKNEIMDLDSHILSKPNLVEPEILVKEELKSPLLEDESTIELLKNDELVKNDELNKTEDKDAKKLLIIVTTTHVRPFQAYYLNRLAHTLSVVPRPLLWIVVDRYYQSMETARILMATGLMYRHFSCMMNVTNMRKMVNCQRNIAIYHIKKHHINGIVYFADDDGIYSLELFEEMRKIKRFGTWPVATLQDPHKRILLEGPLCNGKRVLGWHSNQNSKAVRRFHTSLSGFAFNSSIIWDSKKWRRHPRSIIFHSTGKGSMQDSKFVELLIEDERQMEGLGDNCTKIMVWRSSLEAPQLNYPSGWSIQNNLQAFVPLFFAGLGEILQFMTEPFCILYSVLISFFSLLPGVSRRQSHCENLAVPVLSVISPYGERLAVAVLNVILPSWQNPSRDVLGCHLPLVVNPSCGDMGYHLLEANSSHGALFLKP
ncbi:hypothetical protein LUZ60_008230 [Juncus effusus]|nr:hypothetical protein LUZ60_008230 [Juncus effusus]